MEVPHVQISLRNVLFFVAIVALNCAAYRTLYRMVENVSNAGPLWHVTGNVVIGALPLFNVGFIGTVVYVARGIRSRRRGSGGNPRFGPTGITFFSLHFLALGFVITALMPDLIEVCVETLAPANEFDWKAVVDRYPTAFSGFFIKCASLAALISGLPFVLSWIGHRLARRCAATVSPFRFGLMTCLVSLGFASVAVAIWLRPRPFAEERDVDLLFQVVDKDSGRPIGAAVLRMTDPFDQTSTPMKTIADADGRAQLAGRFQAVGERIAWRTFGSFSSWGRWLEISAPEYQTVQIPLTEVLGPDVSLENPGARKVRLIRGKTPGNLFRDLAGHYSTSIHVVGIDFQIEQDGRFIFTVSGCMPPADREFGYLKRNNREIELVPALRAGQALHPLLPSRLQAIPWGDRLFLSTTDDQTLESFCTAGLSLKPTMNTDYTGVYRRDSDLGKPLTGLPKLPLKVWLKFLLDEMGLRTEDGGALPAIAALFKRDHR
jgi:hypothetical protein